MIILPNNKVARNLPEQVGYLTENVEFIVNAINDLDLPTWDETFNGWTETFAGWSEDYATWKADFEDWTDTFGGWETTFASWSSIMENMSTAAVGAIAGQAIAPASVAATGAITGGTIKTGYNAQILMTLSASWLNGLTAQNLYLKAVVENNIMYFVLSFRLANETGSDLSTTDQPVTWFSIPEAYRSLIYRKDGTNLNSAPTDGDNITHIEVKISDKDGKNFQRMSFQLYSGGVGSMSFSPIYGAGNNITVAAGKAKDVDIRFFLTL